MKNLFRNYFSYFYQAKKINTNFLKRIKRNPNCTDKTVPWILRQSGSREAVTRGQCVAPRARPPEFEFDSTTDQPITMGRSISLSGLSFENEDNKSAYLIYDRCEYSVVRFM